MTLFSDRDRARRALEKWGYPLAFVDAQRELADAFAQNRRLAIERDALLSLLVVESCAKTSDGKPLWQCLLPDSASPLGWSWCQDFPTREACLEAFWRVVSGEFDWNAIRPETIDPEDLPELGGVDREDVAEWLNAGGEGAFVMAPQRVRCEHCGAEFGTGEGE